MTAHIRQATLSDTQQLMDMIRDLAIYEKMEDMLKITPDFLEKEIIAENPSFTCFVAEDGSGHLIGYCALYLTMSLFLGAKGLHIHDLYVREDARAKGIGTLFMKHIAQYAHGLNYQRITWEALDWNEPAINFYKKLGAEHQTEWDMFKLEGNDIKTLANT
jgi:GNAT superfamily N-acetyltransferase